MSRASHAQPWGYTINLTIGARTASIAAVAMTNQSSAQKVEWIDLVGTSSFNLSLNVAGVATDASEIKVIAFGL